MFFISAKGSTQEIWREKSAFNWYLTFANSALTSKLNFLFMTFISNLTFFKKSWLIKVKHKLSLERVRHLPTA